jgi:hypothetical protein
MRILLALICWLTPLLAFMPSQNQQLRLSSLIHSMARTPEISRWEVLRSGAVRGVSKFHPVIADGDDITTSALADPTSVGGNKVVTTKSGSLYKLVGQTVAPPAPKSNGASKVASASSGSSGGGLFSMFGASGGSSTKKESTSAPAKAVQSKPVTPVSKAAPEPVLKLKRTPPTVTAVTIGNGLYILTGSAIRSTSGKSQIWKAFKAGADGEPTGSPLTVKLSSNYDSLSRENENFDKVASGLLNGAFVKKYEFLPYVEASKKGFESQSALIIESGIMDLKEFLKQRNFRPLQGKSLRDASAAAGQCIQAMHNSRMVWTDLKTENFVITEESGSDGGGLSVRGIDLESAQPFSGPPIDFSPEACPPEFAEAFLAGWGTRFVLGPSYDMWSLGMMLYELSTGKPYFSNKSGTVITTTLRNPAFVADVSAVEDARLRDLVGKCLKRDPEKRPSIIEFLLHPYFVTSGFGRWSF